MLKQRSMDLCQDQLDCGLVGCRLSQNPCDKCFFSLFSSDETSEGQLLLDVDDFIEGGNEIHRKTTEGFHDKYRCGKAIDLRLAGQEGTRFAGRRVVQHPDFRITVSMDEYVKSKLRPIEVPRGYLSNTKEITITIWPIPFAELRWTTFTDLSFDTGERQRHQQGWLVCATNKYFNQERSAGERGYTGEVGSSHKKLGVHSW